MIVLPSNLQDAQTAIAVLVTTGLCVAYWRLALRLILIAVIALTIYGVVVGIAGVTSLMAPHHH